MTAGEIHAIVGENGAGKSTLMKVLAGVYELTSGELIFDGKPLQPQISRRSARAGHRDGVSGNQSRPVDERGAEHLPRRGDSSLTGCRGLYIQAQRFLLSLNFYVDPMALVSTLGAGKKQMVEIARAVHHHARVLIFDEPTASLTPEEKFHFFNLVRRLQRDGMSIIFISHALEEALTLSDRITVLRDGEVVATDATGNFDRSRLVHAMVGRNLSSELYGSAQERKTRPYGEEILSVRNLSMGSIVRNTSFSVFSGQITGMFGLVGAGRTETMKIIAGVLKRDFFHGGEVRLNGRPCSLPNAKARGRRRHRLCDGGPQGRRLLRDHVDRGEHSGWRPDDRGEPVGVGHHDAGAPDGGRMDEAPGRPRD